MTGEVASDESRGDRPPVFFNLKLWSLTRNEFDLKIGLLACDQDVSHGW